VKVTWDSVVVVVAAVGAGVWWLVSRPFCRPPANECRLCSDAFGLWERQFDSGVRRVNPQTWDLAESVEPVRNIRDDLP
jgi:hypothetical protein